MEIIIAVPAYNEELVLKSNILKLLDFCQSNLSDDWRVVVADNNSTDKTAEIAQTLASQNFNCDYLLVAKPGKGNAIKTAWLNYQADVYIFMDADLATDLSALPQLVEKIKAGYDIAIGCRFHRESIVSRSVIRNILSYGYSYLSRLYLGIKIKDPACGFKAISDRVKKTILPMIGNNQFFFDSELVILAGRQVFKIAEIPVKWQESNTAGRKSRVNLFKTIWEYLSNLNRIRRF